MRNYASVTQGAYHYVALANNVATEIRSVINRGAQDSLGICVIVDDVTCDPPGVLNPNPVGIRIVVNNNLLTPATLVSVSLGAGSGPGGTFPPSLATAGVTIPGGGQIFPLLNVTVTPNPAGGLIYFSATVTSTNRLTNHLDSICVYVPPCPCHYTDYDYESPPDPVDNDTCDTYSIDCGYPICGEIDPVGDMDWYPVHVPPSFTGCTRLTVNVYGNDTPSQYPYLRGLNPKVELFHDDCTTRLTWDRNSGVVEDPYVSECLFQGLYMLRITGENNSTGPYILETICEPCTCSSSCNDTCDNWLSGLRNWWPLDETSGGTSADIASHRDGTWHGSPLPQPGMVNGGLCFNLSNYVESSNHALNNVYDGSFTLDAWVRWDGTTLYGFPLTIAGKLHVNSGFVI